MAKQVRIIDGMGDYTQGVGADTADFMNYVNSTLSESCVVRSTDFEVSEKGSGADMSVDVAVGDAYILNSSWTAGSLDETKFFAVASDAISNVTITANSSGNPRIDIIVGTVDKITPPNDEATNVFTITAIAGTPAGSPSAPATPANSIKLAEVAVANGATSIIDANITDSRKFLSVQLHRGRLILGTTAVAASGDPAILINTDDYDDIATDDPVIIIEGASGREKIMLKSFGTNLNNYFEGLSGRGTVASPTTTQAGDLLGGIAGGGIDNASAEARGRGFITLKAAENWTTTAQGTYAVVALTAPGTTTRTESFIVSVDSSGNVTLSPAADGDAMVTGRHPRRNHSSNTYPASHIQSGWGYIQGDATARISATVTLPIAYSSDSYRVVISPGGSKGSVPASEGDTSADFNISATVGALTTTQFSVDLYRADGGSLAVGTYYVYNWIAIGPI